MFGSILRHGKNTRIVKILLGTSRSVESYPHQMLAAPFCYQSCQGDVNYFPNKIGCREIVGFGINGSPSYIDSVVYPYPAVRFREITPDYKALKEKEKGSWKMLTIEEKKCLYRISFCQTLEEVMAPTGEWREIASYLLIYVSLGIWLFMFVTLITRDLPDTFKTEYQVAQLKRILDLRMDPVDGLSSKWDYENNNWKGYPSRKQQEKKSP